MSKGSANVDVLRCWVAPRVIKLEALPEALGACITGSTHMENPGGICRNGAYPQHKCKTGMGGAP